MNCSALILDVIDLALQVLWPYDTTRIEAHPRRDQTAQPLHPSLSSSSTMQSAERLQLYVISAFSPQYGPPAFVLYTPSPPPPLLMRFTWKRLLLFLSHSTGLRSSKTHFWEYTLAHWKARVRTCRVTFKIQRSIWAILTQKKKKIPVPPELS